MLVLGLLAALSTVFPNVHVAAVAAAVFFALGAGVAVWTYLERPERLWYEGRAAAESVKTLSWQYAVGGGRFRREADTNGVDEAFVAALRDILETLDLTLPSRGGPQITDAMRALRRADLETRKAAYRQGRIENQRAWYEQRAAWNLKRSGQWRAAIIFLQLVGMTVAIIAVFAGTEFLLGFLGLVATAAASAAAWHQTRDHEMLAEAYSVTAHELSLIEERAHASETDEHWAEFVQAAEQAISREHTLWRARRSRPVTLISRRSS